MPDIAKAKGLQKYHGITSGTVTASKALVVDANKDLSSLRNLTVTGTLTAGTVNPTSVNVTNLILASGGSIDTDSGTATATGTGTAGSVTLAKMAGKITTTSMTAASNSTYVLTITDSVVASTDLVYSSINTYSGTGIPLILTTTPGSGTITITVYNAGGVALNATAVISFLVLKA